MNNEKEERIKDCAKTIVEATKKFVKEKEEKGEKTLGSQILEAYEKGGKGEECREIVLEYCYKNFLPRLQQIVKEEAPKFGGLFYILVFGFPDYHEPIASHIRIIARKSRPRPEPHTILYSYDPYKDEFKYEWILPGEDAFDRMLKDRDSFHPHLIENIEKFKAGTLS